MNFPVSLAALAVLPLVADRLDGLRWDVLAAVSALLCLVVAVPGVVDQNDLDARAANAVPAAGVALALGLTLVAARRTGLGPRRPATAGDLVRLLIAAVIVVGSIPWWFAELGFFVSDVPVLGGVFLAEEVVPEPGHPALRAVHLGHHHGTDGVLLALAALALSRGIGLVRRHPLGEAAAAYLSLLLVYGLANAFQDFWLEQLVKRGTTDLEVPDLLRPALALEWLVVLLAAAAVYALWFSPGRTRSQRS